MIKNGLKERIIPIMNDGNQYFIYFTGRTYSDEDIYGNKVEREETLYLDNNLNKFIMNGSKETIIRKFERSVSQGFNVIVGPHSPEIETADGKYIPNTDSSSIGLWEKASKEDLLKYHRILEKQNEERLQTRLYK